MLESLHVKNLALIDEAEVNFTDGLNILTGETGAGKSLIIGSVNMALGGKADKGYIRAGAEYALVELVFQLTQPGQIQRVKALDIPMEEDGLVILQRRIMPQRSISRVNGETVLAYEQAAWGIQFSHRWVFGWCALLGILGWLGWLRKNFYTKKKPSLYRGYRGRRFRR